MSFVLELSSNVCKTNIKFKNILRIAIILTNYINIIFISIIQNVWKVVVSKL